jgi:hypothetical protein
LLSGLLRHGSIVAGQQQFPIMYQSTAERDSDHPGKPRSATRRSPGVLPADAICSFWDARVAWSSAARRVEIDAEEY